MNTIQIIGFMGWVATYFMIKYIVMVISEKADRKKWAKELKSGKTRPPAMCCEHLSSNIAGCTSEKYEGDSVKNSVNPSE